MPTKAVDKAFADYLSGSSDITQTVYHERVPKGAKPEYIVVAQTGYELPEAYQLGAEAGLASIDCTIYVRSQDLADPIRRAVKKTAKKYRGVQGDYHVTATRLTGDAAAGIDDATGVYTYTISVEIDYTEES
jgi:hypothetical protein